MAMSRLSKQANAIGMVSRISGRFISFYSDELTDLLLDDFLEEVALDLQRIENTNAKSYIN